MDNYYRVTYDSELGDSKILMDKIIELDWLKPDTFIVNCYPEQSSRLSHLISHRLSYLNLDEPFEVRNLPMPHPNMVQVWDTDDLAYKMYSNYLSGWIWKNIYSGSRYLFVGTDIFIHFPLLRSLLRGRVENEDFRIVTLYKPKNSNFLPDAFGKEYEGRLLFQWENINNPNK